jgi:hypothetical protein
MQSTAEMYVPNTKKLVFVTSLSEIPCRVSSDPHEWHNGLEYCLNVVLSEIPIAVKMPFTDRKTERPRGALL